jgi:poly-gamma-glutamate synthesis protein (capsule biosynthesis protein)
VRIAAVGDVLIDRPDPARALDCVRPLITSADIRFANCECAITDSAEPIPGAGLATVVPRSNAAGFGEFEIVSVANNHVLDAGYAGLDDTINALNAVGCRCIGAGKSASLAWAPHVATVRGVRVAFLAITSVLPKGWNATQAGPGVAAIRARDVLWTRHPHDWSPGVAQKHYTAVEKSDIDQLQTQISLLKDQADVVVVSVHWGDYSRPYALTAFERWLACELARCEVDVVIGHHHHSLRGVERIGKTLVLYGLGNLVFDHPRYPQELDVLGIDYGVESTQDLERRLGRFAVFPREQNFPFHFSYRFAAVAHIAIVPGKPPECELIPTMIDAGAVRPLGKDDPQLENWIEEFTTASRIGELQERYCLRNDPAGSGAGVSLEFS